MIIKEIMVKKVITVGKGETVENAFSIMVKNKIRHLPVVENKKLVGIVSDRDLRQALIPWRGNRINKDLFFSAEAKSVSEVMNRVPLSIHENVTVEDAARMMLKKRIGALPVVRKDQVVGIVALSDFVSIFVEMMDLLQASSRLDVEIRDEKSLQIVLSTLKKKKVKTISYGTVPEKKSDHGDVFFFRLGACPVKPIVKVLGEKGIKVVEAIGTDS